MRYSEAFVKYTKNLAAPDYEPLSVERERELLLKYASGDSAAFNIIVKAYLRFVIYLLKDYKIPDEVDIMDIVQEGNLGLIHGLHKFDPIKYSCRVSTYCVHWIRFFINKSLTYYGVLRSVFSPLPDEEYTNDYPRVAETYPIDIPQEIIDYSLEKLNDRERLVVIYFFGLREGTQPKTLQEIASILHIHIERVRQLRDTALGKINVHMLSQIAHNQ